MSTNMQEQQNAREQTTRFPLIRIILLVAALGAGWYFCSRFELWRPRKTVAVGREEAGNILEECGRFFTYIVKPGDTFQAICAGFGIPVSDAVTLYRSASMLGLSSIFPGDSLILSLGRDNTVRTLSLLSRLQCWYHVHRDSMALTAEKEPLSTERHLCVVKGTLTTCLSDDMERMGVGDAVAAKLADIFAWDINFFVDPRAGDRFQVIFEKLYREGRFVDYGDICAATYENNGTLHHAYAFRGEDGRIEYYNNEGKTLRKQFLKAPLKYERISSGYTMHRKHPILGIVRPHLGIDYAAPRGTPVYAAADGVVAFCGKKGGYGNYIRLSHGNGYETSYGHLHAISRGIRQGARVRQGDLIGSVGATGLATGPHLDYRMRQGQRFVNPLTLKLPSNKCVPACQMAHFESAKAGYVELLAAHGEREGCTVADIQTIPPSNAGMRRISVCAVHDSDRAYDNAHCSR